MAVKKRGMTEWISVCDTFAARSLDVSRTIPLASETTNKKKRNKMISSRRKSIF